VTEHSLEENPDRVQFWLAIQPVVPSLPNWNCDYRHEETWVEPLLIAGRGPRIHPNVFPVEPQSRIVVSEGKRLVTEIWN
jgi:hypothetical protein